MKYMSGKWTDLYLIVVCYLWITYIMELFWCLYDDENVAYCFEEEFFTCVAC